MKEAFIILFVVLVLLALTAFRYRKQLAMVLNMWRMLKSARNAHKSRDGQLNDIPAANAPLASCPKCGTWIPQNKAIRIGRGNYYCSSECVEKSAQRV